MMEDLILWLDEQIRMKDSVASDISTPGNRALTAMSMSQAYLDVLDWIGEHRSLHHHRGDAREGDLTELRRQARHDSLKRGGLLDYCWYCGEFIILVAGTWEADGLPDADDTAQRRHCSGSPDHRHAVNPRKQSDEPRTP